MKAWQHFKTITQHRWQVRQGCFKVGLIWQGLTHDLSKYSPTEFRVGAKFWTGNRSPNAFEREEKGYSESWIHHKGRNRHHFEYWTDLSLDSLTYEPVPMPRKYLVESVMDRIAACKIYQGSNYTDASPIEYFCRSIDQGLMHEQTRKELMYLLEMLRDKGEKETFSYIKHTVLKGKPFPWEE